LTQAEADEWEARITKTLTPTPKRTASVRVSPIFTAPSSPASSSGHRSDSPLAGPSGTRKRKHHKSTEELRNAQSEPEQNSEAQPKKVKKDGGNKPNIPSFTPKAKRTNAKKGKSARPSISSPAPKAKRIGTKKSRRPRKSGSSWSTAGLEIRQSTVEINFRDFHVSLRDFRSGAWFHKLKEAYTPVVREYVGFFVGIQNYDIYKEAYNDLWSN
jgi:hypothetical protein